MSKNTGILMCWSWSWRHKCIHVYHSCPWVHSFWPDPTRPEPSRLPISVIGLKCGLNDNDVVINAVLKQGIVWCTYAFMEQLHCTRRKVAHKQPTSSVINTCGPPASGRWSFRGIDWTVMVVGVLLLRARPPRIRCQTVFTTQLSLIIVRRHLKTHFFANYSRDVGPT